MHKHISFLFLFQNHPSRDISPTLSCC